MKLVRPAAAVVGRRDQCHRVHPVECRPLDFRCRGAAPTGRGQPATGSPRTSAAAGTAPGAEGGDGHREEHPGLHGHAGQTRTQRRQARRTANDQGQDPPPARSASTSGCSRRPATKGTKRSTSKAGTMASCGATRRGSRTCSSAPCPSSPTVSWPCRAALPDDRDRHPESDAHGWSKSAKLDLPHDECEVQFLRNQKRPDHPCTVDRGHTPGPPVLLPLSPGAIFIDEQLQAAIRYESFDSPDTKASSGRPC